MALVIVNVEGKKREIQLEENKEYIIGRHSDCDITIEDKNVSRKHCKIYYSSEEKGFVLSDLGAANGTILNKNKIADDVILSNKDKIVILKNEIYFFDESMDDTATAKIKTATPVSFGIPIQTRIIKDIYKKEKTNFSYKSGDMIGEYKVLELIKDFKYGAVYATQRKGALEKTALKIFTKDLSDNSQAMDDFMNDLTAVAKLDNKALVKNLEAGVHEGHCYVTMAFIPLGDLNSKLEKYAPLTPKNALEVVKDVATALDYAHKQERTIHANLNPAYIMFDKNENVVLTDNGLANWMTEYLADGISTALPWYISPEQISGERNIDWYSDMYSLGIILIQMLTGSLPYDSDNEEENLAMQLEMALPKPKELNPNVGVSKNVWDILTGMTQKKPEDRFQTWSALIKAIDMVDIGSINSPIRIKQGSKAKVFTLKKKVTKKKLTFKRVK